MDCSTPGLPVHHQLPEFTQTHVHWVYPDSCPLSWWCHPTISSSVVPFSCLQSFPVSRSFPMSQFFHIKLPKYWSFSFSISPSNEHPGLISFRMDWLGLLAVQGTLKSLLQHHSSKASILWSSAFFLVQLSHPYVTTGKTIALTRWTLVDKPYWGIINSLPKINCHQVFCNFLYIFCQCDGHVEVFKVRLFVLELPIYILCLFFGWVIWTFLIHF